MSHPSLDSRIDTLVAGFYRAAGGELPWVQPLVGMSELFGAWGIQLMGIRVADGSIAFSHDAGGPTPEGVLEYLRYYHRIDPRANLVMPLPAGHWISCHEHFDESFVARDPFYRDYLIPSGGRYVSGGKIYQDDELVVLIGIHRGRGSAPLQPDEVALGRRFGSHIQTALGLWRRQMLTVQTSLVGNAQLARLGHPVLLIDEQLRIHFRNAAAADLIRRDGRIRESSGCLVCTGPGGADSLRLAMRRLRLGGEAPYPDTGPAEQRVVVRAQGRDGGAPLLLLLSALRSTETLGAFGPLSLAMVLIHDPSLKQRHDPFVVASMYDLTPAESAVAVAIAESCEVRAIARNHGVAVATVRSQLHSVFAKMGVRRQSDIVAALAAIPAFGVKR